MFGGGSLRDNFQVADAGEFGKDFILSAIGEISIVWVTAQVLEWENRDTFLRR